MISDRMCYVEATNEAQSTGGRLREARSTAHHGFLIKTYKGLRLSVFALAGAKRIRSSLRRRCFCLDHFKYTNSAFAQML